MTELLLGISLGWAAGIAPGPLLTLVLTTTLRRGTGAGIRVALAPLITDPPIVVVGVAVASGLSARFVAAISVVGAAYLIWLGISEVAAGRRAELAVEGPVAGGRVDVLRGVLTNVLSPHPWLFWVAVGGPLLVAAWDRRPAAGIGFVVAFYLLIVGTKVGLALLVGRGRRRLTVRWYRVLVQVGGLVLLLLGVGLLWDAVA